MDGRRGNGNAISSQQSAKGEYHQSPVEYSYARYGRPHETTAIKNVYARATLLRGAMLVTPVYFVINHYTRYALAPKVSPSDRNTHTYLKRKD